MPRKWVKRDKKAEFERRPRQPSSDWEERKKRIRDAYGVKLPERTVIICDESTIMKLVDMIGHPSTITTPMPNEYSVTE